MQNIFGSLSRHYGADGEGHELRSLQHASKGTGGLQPVQETDCEPWASAPELSKPVSALSNGKPRMDKNPSRRPLDRRAHDHHESYMRSEVGKRSLYAQAGDVEPSDFRETVAELMKEEEYGVLRLVVPHVTLTRTEFDEYVLWLNKQRMAPDGTQIATRSVFYLPLIPPFSRLSLGWMCFMTVIDLTWTAFGVPINVAFCSIDYGQLHSPCTGTDATFGIIYTLNLLVSFNLGLLVVNGHRKKTVMNGRKVAWLYITRGRFALDLAATVPFVYLLVVLILSDGHGYQAKWVNIVSLIRLVRLLRLISVSKVIYIDSTLGADGWLSRFFSLSTLYATMVCYQILVLINLIACVLILLAYMHGLEYSWMTAVSWTDLVDASRAYQWYCAIYWVITTTTTTGFGDFSPRWWAEQVVIGFAMVIGMIAFGILVGVVSSALTRASTRADRLQAHIKKIAQVKEWLASCKVNEALRLRIQEYFAQIYVAKQSVTYGEEELFEDLPPYLKFEAAGELALPLVKNVHALDELNDDAKQLIAAHMRPTRAIVGQELCRQGDEADRLWILATGRLVALRHKETPQHVTAPALVGESLILAMDIPECRHRPWTLRAALPCELWELKLADLSRVVQIYPAVRLSLLEYLRTALVDALLEHDFRRRVGDQNPQHSQGPLAPDWCELSALIQASFREMHDTDPAALDDLCVELVKANIHDGSLQHRLGELIEDAMVRDGLTPQAVLGLPLDVQHVAAQEQLQQEEEEERLRQQATTGCSEEVSDANNQPPPPGSGGTGGDAGGVAAASVSAAVGAESGLHTSRTMARGSTTGSQSRLLAPHHRFLVKFSSRRQDSHYGPAPWGITTEEALAAAYGRTATGALVVAPAPLPLPDAVAPAPEGPTGQSSLPRKEVSWHGPAAPPSSIPETGPLASPSVSGMLPMPPMTARPPASRLPLWGQSSAGGPAAAGGSRSDERSYHSESGAATNAAAGGGGGNHGVRRTPQRARPAGLDMSPVPSGSGVEEVAERLSAPVVPGTSGSGAADQVQSPFTSDAGAAVEATGRGKAESSLRPPAVQGQRANQPARPPPINVMEDDPIAAETGVVSPIFQEQLQQLHTHLHQRQLEMLEARRNEPIQHTPPPPQQHLHSIATHSSPPGAPRLPQTDSSGSTAAAGPGPPPAPGGSALMSMPSGLRRSQLSRFSSPFAGIGAAGAAALAAAAGMPVACVSGLNGGADMRVGEVNNVPPTPVQPVPCSMCGGCACPLCGAWAAPGSSAAIPRLRSAGRAASLRQQLGAAAAAGAAAAGGATSLPPAGSSTIVARPPVISLVSAMRGAGSAGTAGPSLITSGGTGGGVSMRQRSGGVPPPPSGSGPAVVASSLAHPSMPLSPGPSSTWAAPPPGTGSPVSALGRKSQMFGRSLAAAARMDSLVRHTLMRGTYDQPLLSPHGEGDDAGAGLEAESVRVGGKYS